MRTIFQGPMHQNESSIILHLTHCGLVTPYGNLDQDQYWLR